MRTKEKVERKNQKGYKNFLKVLTYFKNHKVLTVKYLIFLIIVNAVSAFSPIVQGNLLASLAQFDVSQITYFLVLFLILELIIILVRIVWVHYANMLIRKANYDIRKEVFNNVMNIKTKVFDEGSTGDFLERMKNDASKMSNNYLNIVDIITYIITNFAFFIYIVYLNAYIAGVILLFSILYWLIDSKRIRKHRDYSTKLRTMFSKISSIMTEAVVGVRDVKINHSKDIMLNRYLEKEQEKQHLSYKQNMTNVIYGNSVNYISVLARGVVVAFGVYLITQDLFTLTGLLIIYTSFGRILRLGESFSRVRQNATDGEVAAKRVFELFKEENYAKEVYGNTTLKDPKGKVELKNVTFGYKENATIFKNFNLTIDAGQMIGVVGESGGGKSTLLGLISKMYYVNLGEIFIDHVNINDLTENSLRSTISYVSQTPYIFNDTIYNNLVLAKENLTLDEAVEACKIANIHEFINGLEKGYETVVGENGVQLSGGQKQRLAIARALINKNKIILLDEATSALDNESQQKIKLALEQVAKNHTIIVVAHRLSTVIDSDRIIVVKEGVIVGDDTHNNLLKNNDYYKELYQLIK